MELILTSFLSPILWAIPQGAVHNMMINLHPTDLTQASEHRLSAGLVFVCIYVAPDDGLPVATGLSKFPCPFFVFLLSCFSCFHLLCTPHRVSSRWRACVKIGGSLHRMCPPSPQEWWTKRWTTVDYTRPPCPDFGGQVAVQPRRSVLPCPMPMFRQPAEQASSTGLAMPCAQLGFSLGRVAEGSRPWLEPSWPKTQKK